MHLHQTVFMNVMCIEEVGIQRLRDVAARPIAAFPEQRTRFCFEDGALHAMAVAGSPRPGLPDWLGIDLPVYLIQPGSGYIDSFDGGRIADFALHRAAHEVRCAGRAA